MTFLLFVVFQPGQTQPLAPLQANKFWRNSHCCPAPLPTDTALPTASPSTPDPVEVSRPSPGQPHALGTLRQAAPSDCWLQFPPARKSGLLRVLVRKVLGNPVWAVALSQTALNARLQALLSGTRSGLRKTHSPDGKSGSAFHKHLFSTEKGSSDSHSQELLTTRGCMHLKHSEIPQAS